MPGVGVLQVIVWYVESLSWFTLPLPAESLSAGMLVNGGAVLLAFLESVDLKSARRGRRRVRSGWMFQGYSGSF